MWMFACTGKVWAWETLKLNRIMVSSSPKVFMFRPNKLLIKAILDIFISKDKVQISKNILNAKAQRKKQHGDTEAQRKTESSYSLNP